MLPLPGYVRGPDQVPPAPLIDIWLEGLDLLICMLDREYLLWTLLLVLKRSLFR